MFAAGAAARSRSADRASDNVAFAPGARVSVDLGRCFRHFRGRALRRHRLCSERV